MIQFNERFLKCRGRLGHRLLFLLPALVLLLSYTATAYKPRPGSAAKPGGLNKSKAGAMLPLQPVSVKKNSLSIAVDPRIEILSIVQYLSNYGEELPHLVTSLQHSYRKDTDSWFSKFKADPAIKMFDRMSLQGFSYDAPPHAVLYLKTDLSLSKAVYKDNYVLLRAGGKEQMVAFADALRAFAVRSDFPKFYRNHIAFYKQITEETAKNVENKDVMRELEQYYGEKKHSYTAVISPLLGGGAFGCAIDSETGAKNIYSVIGPGEERNGIPAFGSAEAFRQLQWHEFSHSFVNSLTDKHQGLCDKYSHLFPPMEKKMRTQAYGSWVTVVNESIIRAVTARLSYRLNGRDSGDKELQDSKRRGFVFTEALVKKLEEYEQNRSQYPTLDSFYPQLLKALDGFTESTVKELAGSDLVLNEVSKNVRSLVYEIPDEDGRDDVVRYIGSVHDRFFSKLEMNDAAKLDDSALKDKLKRDFVLYTTINEKAGLFKAVTEPLHMQIDGGMLRWNGVNAPVKDLRIIMVGKNPYGDGYCMVYAAGSNKLLIDVNNHFHGPCSYHIFQGDTLLKEGFYNEKFVLSDPKAEGER